MTHNEKLDIHIRICCDDMGDAVMMNEFREGMLLDDEGLYIWWKDGDLMPVNYCPSCGKKIEVLK